MEKNLSIEEKAILLYNAMKPTLNSYQFDGLI